MEDTGTSPLMQYSSAAPWGLRAGEGTQGMAKEACGTREMYLDD